MVMEITFTLKITFSHSEVFKENITTKIYIVRFLSKKCHIWVVWLHKRNRMNMNIFWRKNYFLTGVVSICILLYLLQYSCRQISRGIHVRRISKGVKLMVGIFFSLSLYESLLQRNLGGNSKKYTTFTIEIQS